MATGNHKKAMGAEEVTAFGGLDASSPHGDGGIACNMKNFKVLSDGSLVKRDGFAILATLGADVRAVHVLHEAEGDFILAVAGAWLYRISVADGGFESAEVLTTVSGRACFFDYGGELYLMDGAEVYRWAGGVSLAECLGYIPLYGANWDPYSNVHPINEPINLFSKKIRVHYLVEQSLETFTLNVGVGIASVDKVLSDGVATTDYTVPATNAYIRFTSPAYRGEVEICMTLEDSYWHDAAIRSCARFAKYDSFSGSRIFLYGGEEGGLLYASLPVSEASLAAAQVCDGNATALYFPKASAASFDNGQNITAVGRVGDRMMICTADGAWVTGTMSEHGGDTADKLPVVPLSQTVGCRAAGGIALMEGDAPVTLSAGGIYRWDIDPTMERGCTVERISDGMAAHVDDGFFRGADVCYVRAEDELWFYLPGDEEGRVFIYNCGSKLWYSYVGIQASRLFDVGGRVGFAGGAEICLFDAARTTDLCSFGEREIVGVFESRRMDFGDSEAKKRAVRVYAEADAAGGELTVGLYDGGLLDEITFADTGEGAACYCSRVNTCRFRRLSVTLRAAGAGRQRVYGFCVHIGM